MSRDQQRYRKNYSYYRPLPREGTITFAVDESLDWKNSVRTASTGNHALSGAGTSLSIGGVTVVDEDRVLLKNQGTPSQNGIYYFEVTGGNYALTRASDARQGTLTSGAATYVEEGTNGGKIYILSTTGTITVDSTSLTWTEFSSGGGGGGGGNDYWVSTTAAAIYSTGSVAIRGGLGSVDAAADIGTDVFFFVSGSITGSGVNDKKAVFGGDVRMSGSLEVSGDQVEITGSLRVTNGISGSLTKLTDGTSYLIAGPNITINTGSNGAVQITGSAGGGGVSGTGTAYKHARFSAASTIESSLLEDGRGDGPTGLPLPGTLNFLTSSAEGFHFPSAQRWTVAPSNIRALVINEDGFVFNASARSVGIGTANPADPLHIAHYSIGSDSAFIGSSMRTIRLQNTSTTAGNSTSIVNIGNVGIGNSDINAHISFVNLAVDSAAITFGTKQNASSFGERMRIDEAGNVGIGSITPTSIGADVFLFVSGSSGSLGTSTRGVAAFGGDVIVSGSLKVGTGSVFITSNDIQFGSSAMRIQRSSSDMTFFANSSESFRIKSGGNIGINTNNPSEKLHVNSGNVKVDTTGYGIILPSSPTNVGAQTLDCYLETEMEVNLVCSLEGPMTLDYAYDMLRMTRIGRSVHLQGKLKVDVTNAAAGGDLWISLSGTGIPGNGTFDSAGSVYLTGFSASLVEPVYAIIEAGGDRIYLRRFYQGSLMSDLANYIAKSSGSAEITISITYSI